MSIALLAFCEVAALVLWFSATAVVPSISAEYPLSPQQISLFTSAVQAGFVIGTLISAVLGLADRIDPRRFFMLSALVAAGANSLMLWLEPGTLPVYVARFVIGVPVWISCGRALQKRCCVGSRWAGRRAHGVP